MEGEDDGAEDEDVNEPEEDQVPSANQHSRTRRRGVKSELVEENERAGPSARMTRRALRSSKAEAVEAAQEVPSAAGPSQSTRASKRRKN